MKKHKRLAIILNLALLLLYVSCSIMKKEKLLKSGRLVLLELAPVDPRSLMQGDYMALRYKISKGIVADSIAGRGYCVVRVGPDGVATKLRFQNGLTPLHDGEHLIQYASADNWNINIGAESFFFQEGEAGKYEKAKYGGLKIDRSGNSLLVGLYDRNAQLIE